MSDFFDSSSDSDDGSVENFGIPVATQPLPTPQLQALRIRDHVLVTLDYEKDNYGIWRRQFVTALSKFGLWDHIDGTPAQGSSDWVLNDFAIVSWFDATVTPSTLAIVETRAVSAFNLWRSLRAVFRDNRDTRATFLRDEFHGFNQGDLSVVDYTSQMKHMADTLGDLGSRVKDRELVHNVLRGLDQRLQHAVPHMTRGRLPSFIQLRSFLLLEEKRLSRQARVVAHNALLAQAYQAAGAPVPAHIAQAFHAAGAPVPAFSPTPPAPASFSPSALGLYGAGASHAGASSSGAPAGTGKKKRKKNPAPAGPVPYAAAPNSGSQNPGYRPPAPRPTAPTMAGTFQAWSAPGVLGPRPQPPPAPRALTANTAPTGQAAPSWDQAALIAALNQMTLQASADHGGQAQQGNEWVFDSGASSHMSSGSGITSLPLPPNFPTQIIVGNGSVLPIVGSGSAHLSTAARSLILRNILLCPQLIKNLVSVRAFTRDNFVSIEFDPFGFSIKDLATGRVLHRCDSTGDLYPFVPPLHCLHASVSASLWHERLGHPSAEALKMASKHKHRADGSLERYKARWVVRGFAQRPGIDFGETFSPVVKPATIRTVLSLACSRNWPVHQLDVKNAFLHGVLEEQVYCYQPTGFVDSLHRDHVCKLAKSLYGLKQAPRAWFKRFAAFAITIGFVASRSDASLFILKQGSDVTYLLLYVDDIVLSASTSPLLHAIIAKLKSEFAMKDMGPLHYFLGIQVRRTPRGFFLSQAQYADEILQRAGMTNCTAVSTPMDTNSKVAADAGSPVADPSEYRSLAGALQYLTMTRPDLAYAVQQICQHMHDPRDGHLAIVKRILRWSSKRQATVSRSSAEAEYRAVANAVADCVWLRQLLGELSCPVSKATVVFCDNVSAVYMSTNPVHHRRTKHIELDIHFVREKVALGELRVVHIPTTQQLADVMTKGLPAASFQSFRSSLCVLPVEDLETAAGC
ncbi:uncharacterized protein [Lolium perenne]|uniref:uncharacterized protein n=1 Tax=Lolium perenne TaxID=4522 RepID=UPI003A992898